MQDRSKHKAVVLLSGGMDSSTCLWWVRAQGRAEVHTVSIDYGQRHRVELEFSARLSARAGAASHKVIHLDLTQFGGNPLTDAGVAVPRASEGQQARTVVPYRNMLFITLAAAHAETLGISDLHIAVVRDDYRSYRDCRRAFYDGLEQALSLGGSHDREVRIHSPFGEMWKTEVIRIGLELGVPYEETHTCYEGKRPACGLCDACVERIAAFKANGVRDPIAYEIEVKW
ncbi:7-cyano-7-deazaguanine synthase QueC [bacterium]|nr:7-cyano-7-deazaguanine synthase QueC [bacterium]